MTPCRRWSRTRASDSASERYAPREIRFHGWRETRLGFTPRYTRTADDLGARALEGIGKAEYWCPDGVAVLNLAPVSPVRPRPGQPWEGEPADSIVRHLLFLERVWNRAHESADTTALWSLFAGDITVQVPEMPVMRRSDLMRFWRSGRSTISVYSTTDLRVRAAGDSNVVEGLLTRQRDFSGRARVDVWRFRKTYAIRDGRWRVVRYVAVLAR